MFVKSFRGDSARCWRGILPVWLMILFAVLAGWTGCGGCSTPTATSTTPSTGSSGSGAEKDLIDPAIAMMQPERLGLYADPEQANGLLNQWRGVHLEVNELEGLGQPLPEAARTLLQTSLSEEALARTERDTFSTEDVSHIRTSLLMKAIVSHVVKGVDGELNRARLVFDYIARNLQLVSDDKALPLTPYEMLIFGEGTAADRAWVFAELMRQLQQDAVIVRPISGESPDSESLWFIGAVANQRIHLFDPLRSTAVPAGVPTNSQVVPATLDDLVKPEGLAFLLGDSSGMTAAKPFEKVRLELIGTSMLWAPRNAKLQSHFTGENFVVISQPLTAPADNSTSIINRLAALSGSRWDQSQIRVWSHPESRLMDFAAAEKIGERWKPFEAPVRFSVDPETGQLTVGSFSKLQLETRIQQLAGQYKEAIPNFMRVQLVERRLPAGFPRDLVTLHRDAAEDAMYFSALCQMEQGEFEGASNKFRSEVKTAEQFLASRHGDHARVLLARCLMQLDPPNPTDALAALEPLKESSPEYDTAMFLKRLWATAPSESPTETSPPETDSTTETTPPKPAIAEKPTRG